MKKLKILSLLLFSTLIVSACTKNEDFSNADIEINTSGIEFIEGVHYEKVNYNKYASDEYQIEKYFWIGCEHCQNMEKLISAYESESENIKIKRIHAPLSERWILDSRIYYALIKKEKEELYPAMIKFYEDYRLNNSGLPNISDLEDFLSLNGINTKDFFKIADSMEVTDEIISVRESMVENKITSVPTIIINGKYKVSQNLPVNIQSQDDYNELLNYLINKKEKNEE